MAEWFIRVGDVERGPFSTDKVKQLAAAGKINPNTMVRRDDSKWLLASKVKGLFDTPPAVVEQLPPDAPASAVRTMAEKAGGAFSTATSSLMSLIPPTKHTIDVPATSVVAKVDATVPSYDQYVTDGQDSAVICKVTAKVQSILTSREAILYIAVQAKPILNMFPDCVALTTRRFIVYRTKLLGRVDFEDYLWRDLRNVRFEENMIGSTIRFQTVDGRSFSIDYIPKEQGRKLYRIAQEHEEEALDVQRNRMLEEKRAGAGGVFVQANAPTLPTAAPSQASDDPMVTLQKLKAMADVGLITAAEFDAKRSEILSRM